MSDNSTTSAGSSIARREMIVILDFGSQYSHLIARRVRELHVFCELFSCLCESSAFEQHNVSGIILSGGPSSVYESESPHVSDSVWRFIKQHNTPVLGICYGMQEIAHVFGGLVQPSPDREYGKAIIQVSDSSNLAKSLFGGIDLSNSVMWMSHGDKVTKLPDNFVTIAHTTNSENAAIASLDGLTFGLQFHPEVTHSQHGQLVLRNFVVNICHAPTDWVLRDIAEEFIIDVRQKVGPTGHVIGAVSGGVDSSVAAALLHRAIGDRFHAVLVDNGFLRKDEAKKVVIRLKEHLGINLTVVDASDRFVNALTGVEDPETKRKTIGRLFIEVFQEEAIKIGDVEYLLQGTLYPDVIESISYKGPSATIKTHHNVGGLPDLMHLKLIEPLRELFKDEVRELGIALGIDEESVYRHPFPGPGLAIRVLGNMTRERIERLREADDILLQELVSAGVYREIGQAFVVLLPVKSVGVMGDSRTYEEACAIRCVATTDFMTADWYHMDYALLGKIANRIINEVKGINRVCYDVSSKPPATIEWE